jgi:hypothetical protein
MRATSLNIVPRLGAALLALAAAAPAWAVQVHMDQSTVVDLAAPAGGIIVGNASIADVTLINPRRVAILGRAYGLTNVIVTDRMGRTIFQQEVNVAPAPTGRVSLYRGPLLSNFACSPRCERTAMPGEDKDKNYEIYSTGYKDYDERSSKDVGSQNNGNQ